MDKSFLASFKWIVIGALVVYLGIIAAIGTFLILRGRVFRPMSSARHRKELTPEEQQEANQRRRKIRFWFWGGR